MGHFEERFVYKRTVRPWIWCRYIDDIFAVWTRSEEELKSFIQDLNQAHRTIKFTVETSKTAINFLDVTFLRIRRICSSTSRYREKAFEFRHHFQKRGFEETLLDAAITRAQERSRKDTLQKKTLTTYVKKANNFKSHRTGKCYAIRTHINCQSKNIVYLIQCKKCGVQYVGETKQTLANRLNGHRSAINTKKDTPVSAHFNQTHHSVGDREILGIERLRYTGNEDLTRQRRLQRESYWIHQLRTSHPDGLSQESIEITRMVKAAESGARRINIVCEDTYVFVLLLHYYAQWNLTCRLTMEGPRAERITIDIGATASEHGHLLSQLPAAHALSVCDTVAQCFGVGKSTVIKVLTSGVELHKLGVLSEDMGDIIEEATAFMAACYGVKSVVTSNMSEVRGEVWCRRMGRKYVTKAPDLR
ncbi:corticospinal neuron axon guidance through spinal cord [Branchiostoma belcheri]|nr:corticospinal neuron axon guidance through spinal cord [Branchiostoma belcheri]